MPSAKPWSEDILEHWLALHMVLYPASHEKKINPVFPNSQHQGFNFCLDATPLHISNTRSSWLCRTPRCWLPGNWKHRWPRDTGTSVISSSYSSAREGTCQLSEEPPPQNFSLHFTQTRSSLPPAGSARQRAGRGTTARSRSCTLTLDSEARAAFTQSITRINSGKVWPSRNHIFLLCSPPRHLSQFIHCRLTSAGPENFTIHF